MACSCMKSAKGGLPVDAPGTKRPDEPCVFCAEKHLAVSYELRNECGYENKNRMKCLANLVLAQWHLWSDHRALASKIRDIRHVIQSWKPLPEEMWDEPLAEIQAITHAESMRLAETNV